MAVTAFTKEYNRVAIVDQDECCGSILGKLAHIASSETIAILVTLFIIMVEWCDFVKPGTR